MYDLYFILNVGRFYENVTNRWGNLFTMKWDIGILKLFREKIKSSLLNFLTALGEKKNIQTSL